MRISIAVCIGTFIVLVWMLRRNRISLGLPVAYLANLHLIHVPGAIGKVLDKSGKLTPAGYTRTGIMLTALGTVAFVTGVAIARRKMVVPLSLPAARSLFWRYCVLGGGIVAVISYLIDIPSVGAVFARGGVIWMLGVLLGLSSALWRGDRARAARWLAVLALYPILMLMIGGFLSYGSMAVIIIVSSLAVTARTPWRVALISVFSIVLGINMFISYFHHRPEIRAAVWGGSSTDARIEAVTTAIKDVKMFDPNNVMHLFAIDQRLNQNYFVGLAAERLENKRVDYLRGRSLWEGVQAMVPRALWPDKPVVAGSPKIVSEMTGLTLSKETSFGVGNVMEFHINFGIPGVIAGFLLLGWGLGRLDRRAAEENARGNLGQVFLFFVPAVALIQPNGSIVEMGSGVAAAYFAAYGWRWAWGRWTMPTERRAVAVPRQPQPLPS